MDKQEMKDINEITKDQEIEQLKQTVIKCKKLIKLMEGESKQKDANITKLKEKLNEYELGNFIVNRKTTGRN
jgi:hypothetical protein